MNRRLFSKAVACLPLLPAGYQYKSHRCPVGKCGVLLTRTIDSSFDVRQFYGLVSRRNASSFGGHPPGTVMLTSWECYNGVWSVGILKRDFGPNDHLVKHGVLDLVYPLADFTPLEVFLP